MMSLFSSDTNSDPPTARRLAWYGLFAVGMMIVLWVGVRAAGMPSSTPEAAPQTADSTAGSSSMETGATEIEIFTWGNVAAALVLATGGGLALYLRRQQGDAHASSPFQRLGTLSLGASKHIQLVACGGEILLLGVTEEEVTLLKTYAPDAFEGESVGADDEPLPATEGAPSAPPLAGGGSFADVLNRFADRTSPS